MSIDTPADLVSDNDIDNSVSVDEVVDVPSTTATDTETGAEGADSDGKTVDDEGFVTDEDGHIDGVADGKAGDKSDDSELIEDPDATAQTAAMGKADEPRIPKRRLDEVLSKVEELRKRNDLLTAETLKLQGRQDTTDLEQELDKLVNDREYAQEHTKGPQDCLLRIEQIKLAIDKAKQTNMQHDALEFEQRKTTELLERTVGERYVSDITEYAKIQPKIDKAVAILNKYAPEIDPDVRYAIVTHPHAAALTWKLGTVPGLLDSLRGADPITAARALGKIEATLSDSKTVTVAVKDKEGERVVNRAKPVAKTVRSGNGGADSFLSLSSYDFATLRHVGISPGDIRLGRYDKGLLQR